MSKEHEGVSVYSSFEKCNLAFLCFYDHVITSSLPIGGTENVRPIREQLQSFHPYQLTSIPEAEYE